MAGGLRDRAGLRPDRRGAGRAARHPRGQALARRRRAARCCGCPQRVPYGVAMELALTGDPIDAERAARARPGQPADRARRRGRRGARARRRRSRPTVRSRSIATKEVLQRQRDWPEEDVLGAPGRDRRAGLHVRGRPRGRDGVRGEARPGLDRDLTYSAGLDRRGERQRRGTPRFILPQRRRSWPSEAAGSRWRPGTRCWTTTSWG